MPAHHGKLKTAALALLLLALGGICAWLFARPVAEFVASRAVGREVAIAGDFDIDLFPVPALAASRVAVAAPDWSAGRHLLTIRRLSVSVDPAALLHGRLVLGRVDLESPTLFLERNAEGHPNWGAAGQARQGEAAAPLSGLPTVRQLSLSDGRLFYHAHGAETLEVRVARASWEKDSKGPGVLRANGTLAGEPWEIELSARPSDGPGDVQRYRAHMQLQSDIVQAGVRGEVGWPLTSATTDIALSVNGAALARLPGTALAGRVMPGPYAASGRLRGRGKAWQATGLRLRVGGNLLRGRMAIDASTPRPEFSGTLVLAALADDLGAQLVRAWHGARESGSASSFWAGAAGHLRHMDGRLVLAADPATVGGIELRGFRAEISLQGGILKVDPLVLHAGGGSLHATVRIDADDMPLQGRATLIFENLPLAPIDGARLPGVPRGGRLQGEAELAFSAARIEQARATLRFMAPGDTDVQVRVRQPAGRDQPLRLLAHGRLRGTSLHALFSGRPLALFAGAEPSPFTLSASLGRTRASATGRSAGAGFPITFSLAGPGTAALSRPLGIDMPALPRYAASGRMTLTAGHGIRLQGADVRVGQSRFEASGGIDDLLAPRSVHLRLRADRLVLADFAAATAHEGSAGAWLPPLAQLDADLDLRAARIDTGAGTALRDVRIDAALRGGRLDLHQLRLGLGGGTIAARARLAGIGGPAPHGVVRARIDDVRLGRALRPLGVRRRLPGILDGQLSLALGAVEEGSTHGLLHYRDHGAGSDIRIRLRQTPQATLLDMSGRYRREPVRVHASAGSPLGLLPGGGKYPFELWFVALATRGHMQGVFRDPLRLDGLSARLSLSGPTPRRIEPVLGFRMPELPPYSLTGRLTRSRGVWQFGPIHGTVGNSDLSGRIRADLSGGRPTVTATLRSRLLDLDDIAGVIGGAPGSGPGDVASDEQRTRHAALARRATVLPDEEFGLDELARMDAQVAYTADRVATDVVPMESLRMVFTASGGELAISPLTAAMAGGTVTARMRLRGVPGARPVRGHLVFDIAGVRLRRVLRKLGAGSQGAGRIGGHGAFDTTSASVAAMLGSLDGTLSLNMAGGTLDALLVELGGLDVGEALLLWLGDDRTYSINCARIQATARGGTLDLAGSVLDTTDTRFTLDGQVRLRSEQLDLRLSAHPKDISLFAARSPFVIDGSFRHPGFHPSWGGLAARAAAAAGLALIAPPAALLAFVEPGLGDTAPCAAPEQ